jgi:predicted aspartyl protease
MSIVRTEITLKNAGDLTMARRGYIQESDIREITVQAMVDTGAWTLVINEAIREKLVVCNI